MLSNFLKVFKVPEIRSKILVVGGWLIVFRLFAAIPIPGIDVTRSVRSANVLIGSKNAVAVATNVKYS